jgi:hypothetical protein
MGKGAAKGGFQDSQTAKARSGHRVQSLPKDLAAAIEVRLSVPRPSWYPVNSVEAIVFHRIACRKGIGGRKRGCSAKVRGEVVPSEEGWCKRRFSGGVSSEQLIELVGDRFEHIPTRPQGAADAVFSTIQ